MTRLNFKPLNWKCDADTCHATAPVTGRSFYIHCDNGVWYPGWDVSLPGTTDLVELKLEAQKFHESEILEAFE